MASMTSSVAIVTINSTGNVITLTGVGTSWTSGTTFTISGGSGSAITAHSNISGTSESITISAGSAYGALTISDGTNTCTINVAPTQALSPFFTQTKLASLLAVSPVAALTRAQLRELVDAAHKVSGGDEPTTALSSIFV